MREKGRAAIYSMAGVYLIVMDYNLWSKLNTATGSEYMIMLVFAIVFAIAATGLIGFSAFIMNSSYKKEKKQEQSHIENSEEN